MPMEIVYKALLKAGALDEEQKKKRENEDGEGQHCQYHKRPMGHSIQDCQDFLGLVQELMDERRIKFCKEIKRQVVNVLQGETLKPIIIRYRGGGQQAPTKAPIHPILRVVLKVPTPFRYTNDKAVPWNYTNRVVSPEP